MKRNLLLLLLMVGIGQVFSQTIVSTDAENKKVILEEFTGIHCGYCPDGHRLANLVAEANPGNAFLINIHTGSFATPGAGEPDFNTEWGAAIAGQTGLTGYPAGTINRHLFPGMQQGSGSAMSRGDFATAAGMVLAEASYVNLGVEASVDFSVTPALLTVHVETYYTGTDAPPTNKLNVALVQDSILGPQSGMAANPDYVVGDQYLHMHALRHMLTGQWGDDITTTTQGTFVDRTYTWEIPSSINEVILNPNQLNIIAFIAESEQEIISGNECHVEVIPPTTQNDCDLMGTTNIPEIICGEGLVSPIINVLNKAGNPITSMEITYDANDGTPMVYNWTGNIIYYANEEITLPELSFPVEATNTINITVTKVNGETDPDPSNNSITGTTNEASEVVNVTLDLKTDNYGSETTWQLKNEEGDVLYSGGPYTDASVLVEDQTAFDLPVAGCYTFEIHDSYGDGMNAGYGVGYYKLYTEGELFLEGGTFGSVDIAPFNNTIFDGLETDIYFSNLNIYPNPSTGLININNMEGAQISVMNIVGQQVIENNNASHHQQINLSDLDNGSYLVRIKLDNQIKTQMIILKK
ncbi:Omp28-related outer membrane protein [Lentimicrobium sp. L6]|uniref:T9SS type A sorting domain-containing protein n=1 Tax=Lentimicrobium sp. L6 TaxID=2735916 RepID=UPI0015521C42|nr:Omp28-related outer membrane protein [Lentimicrobium sp. L6]NPD84995.1 Omp28-related outer membrane protein [Lentimicrobium sp. L6]